MALSVTRNLIAQYLGQPVETETTTSTTPQKSGDKALIWEFKSVWSRVFGSHVDVAATEITDRLLFGTSSLSRVFAIFTKTDEEREFFLECYDLIHTSAQAPLERRFWRCLAERHNKEKVPIPVVLVKGNNDASSCCLTIREPFFGLTYRYIRLNKKSGYSPYTDGAREFLRQPLPREILLHEAQHLFRKLQGHDYNSSVEPDEELGKGEEVMIIRGYGIDRLTRKTIFNEFSDRAFAQARGEPWRTSHTGYAPEDLAAVVAAAHVVIAAARVCTMIAEAFSHPSRHR